MRYDFKLFEEAGWAAFTAAATVALITLSDLDNVTDWKAWGFALLVGCVRAGAGAALGRLRGS
jgi:hypothetical protein